MDKELLREYIAATDRARSAREAWQALEKERKALGEQVLEQMGDAEEVRHGYRKISRRVGRGGFSYREAQRRRFLSQEQIEACFVGGGKPFLVVR